MIKWTIVAALGITICYDSRIKDNNKTCNCYTLKKNLKLQLLHMFCLNRTSGENQNDIQSVRKLLRFVSKIHLDNRVMVWKALQISCAARAAELGCNHTAQTQKGKLSLHPQATQIHTYIHTGCTSVSQEYHSKKCNDLGSNYPSSIHASALCYPRGAVCFVTNLSATCTGCLKTCA